jgi:streptogramin lyase
MLIGLTGLILSKGTSYTVAAETTDHFTPVRNFTGGVLTNPVGITFDSAGNIWMTHYDNNSVTKLNRNGKPLSPIGGFTGGGLNEPLGIAIDSVGNVWIANFGNNSVTKLDSNGKAISPSGGFTSDRLKLPYALAIDSEGNVWVEQMKGTISRN